MIIVNGCEPMLRESFVFEGHQPASFGSKMPSLLWCTFMRELEQYLVDVKDSIILYHRMHYVRNPKRQEKIRLWYAVVRIRSAHRYSKPLEELISTFTLNFRIPYNAVQFQSIHDAMEFVVMCHKIIDEVKT